MKSSSSNRSSGVSNDINEKELQHRSNMDKIFADKEKRNQEVQIISCRIEHARRNIEVLGKVMDYFTNTNLWSEQREECKKILLSNLKIMGETDQIK